MTPAEQTEHIASVIRTLPGERIVFTLGARERTYEGASLVQYASATGLLDSPLSLPHGYFMVTATDGARAAVALAEALPEISPRPIVLATAMDGEALRVGVRLIVPREGTRSLLGVCQVEYHVAEPGRTGAASTTLLIDGDLRAPGSYDLERFTTRPVASEDGQEDQSGVPLHDVLAAAGMFYMTDGERLAQLIVVVTSEDGSHAVLAASEVGPEYAGDAVMLVVQPDATLSLVVPHDRTPSRRLERVVSVSLRVG